MLSWTRTPDFIEKLQLPQKCQLLIGRWLDVGPFDIFMFEINKILCVLHLCCLVCSKSWALEKARLAMKKCDFFLSFQWFFTILNIDKFRNSVRPIWPNKPISNLDLMKYYNEIDSKLSFNVKYHHFRAILSVVCHCMQVFLFLFLMKKIICEIWVTGVQIVN